MDRRALHAEWRERAREAGIELARAEPAGSAGDTSDRSAASSPSTAPGMVVETTRRGRPAQPALRDRAPDRASGGHRRARAAGCRSQARGRPRHADGHPAGDRSARGDRLPHPRGTALPEGGWPGRMHQDSREASGSRPKSSSVQFAIRRGRESTGTSRAGGSSRWSVTSRPQTALERGEEDSPD